MDKVLRHLSSGRLLRFVTSALILAIVGMQSFALWRSYQETWRDGERYTANTISVLAGAIERDFLLVESSLTGLAEALRESTLMELPAGLRQRVLFRRAGDANDFGVMLVLDAQGNVLFDDAEDDLSARNFADRDYFRVHQESSNAGVYVSRPFVSRLASAAPAIGISQRLNAPDGSFAGVAVASIRLIYFRQLFERVKLPPGGIIRLTLSDGTVVLRYPSTDGRGNVGDSVPPDPSPPERAGTADGWWVETSRLDGERRFLRTAYVGGYPLSVTVGLSERRQFGGWYLRAAITLALTVTVSLLLALTVSALATSLRRSREMERQLERMAITDSLTGLPNRRALDLTLDVEMQRSRRERRELAVLMIDIDHFKRVNDTYGHAVGDAVLAEVAHRVQRAACRPGDFVCRYGGEEFVVVLPETPAAGAELVGERIRAGVAATAVMTHGLAIEITVSVGIAVQRADDGPGELIARSDTALYTAKRAGRNRVARLETFAA
ncbi:diguanylate cyclase (GGDEF)-like protein [Xanthobacter sp. SG618]|uniref:sensor domain-containing diguanylate cyclase n=1 Tax=Xanthobacter sp. SG618 TaxID=2587121 RepID=UPI00145CF623|nr:sensor domain-containing diguanylate cyclase [Xanthobacter sp. SG618]NMN56447.1 diguanylate cyclase (GGDEF)-like protein [Xanthobacter sp. SG618]